jgi:glucose/arabinose dehydrogenase
MSVSMARLAVLPVLVFALSCEAQDGSGPTTQPAAPATGTRASADAGALPLIRLEPAYAGLEFRRPIFVTPAPDATAGLFVAEQYGRVLVFEDRPDVSETTVFLDLTDRVSMRHNEEGLLSLVFHPDYATNGQFFVYYTAKSPRRSVLSRFTVSSDDPSRADATSEHIILEVEQPYGNHNGGTVLFGPDGMLYLSLGDGGYANDPHEHGQNLGTLLASIIRIDVDHPDEGRAYGIPKDNPFIDTPGARPEIWAYGLRNVWRMHFDRETGALWAGDVGQNAWEEIDLIVRGGNYGWNRREGFHDFPPNSGRTVDGAIDPVAEYGRREGISVTGGYVYRGSAIPALRGAYVYADYASGRIWGVRADGNVATANAVISTGKPVFVSSFGEARDGELLVCGFDRADGREGRLYRVTAK